VASLALLLGCVAAPTPPVASAAPDAAATPEPEVWAFEDLGGGVYASVTRAEHGYSRFANSLVVVGDAGVAVVDTRESPAAARALIDSIAVRTDLPVVAVVNTHWHWDHVNGNQAFVEAFPGAEIVGHPETRRLIESEGAARVGERIEALRGRRERLGRWLLQGATDDGRELTNDEVGQAREIVRADSVKIGQLAEVRLTPPTRLVGDSAVIDLGGRSIVVLHPGPAHTPGDLVVLVPDAALAFMGDLIEFGAPFFGDGTVAGSRDALALLDGRGLGRYLPAHGPMDVGVELFRAQRALLDDLVDAAHAASDSASVEVAARALAVRHAGALPGFEGPEDPRLLEYLAETLRQAIEER
jgi:glyoxylase-like metal-dependent hydrolase (beta-lactamase superfamily II)